MSSRRLISKFERFGELLTKEFQNQAFVRVDAVMGPLQIERHGSWEWTFCRAGEINRYVSLSVMPHETARKDSPTIFGVQFTVGADYQNSFARRTIDDLLLTEDQLSV